MAWERIAGSARRYRNTVTGEILSRRQYDQLTKGITYEQKAKDNKQRNLKEALARPARGRTKARTEQEKEIRLDLEYKRQEIARTTALEKKAAQRAKKTRVKKIRPQLLKTGHRAARVDFTTYEEYAEYVEQMNAVKLPNGMRLITSYGIGIVGYDERTGRELGATLVPLQSPRVKLNENDLEQVTDDFLEQKSYFMYSHHYLHLHFNKQYAEGRLEKARQKSLSPAYRRRK